MRRNAPQLVAGFYPFWFWNSRITAGEVRWQIAQMAAQGIKGFYIHPRQGLELPYLSDAFMDMVQVALDEAERHGMTVHLYDEYPYPSGVAGGEVILGQPQFLATRLVQRSWDLSPGPVRLVLPRGKVLFCRAYPLENGQVDWEREVDLLTKVGVILSEESYVETGLTAYNRKRYFASAPAPVLEATLEGGPYRLFVAVQALVEEHKYWGGFVDVLNPEAAQEFIRLTHERYNARFGDKFGKQIVSIFLDETEPGWSSRLPQAFLEEYGYDLIPLLPALVDPSHPHHVKVAKDLHRLQYKLFLAAFEGPISRWCEERGLLYAAEKPSLRFAQLAYSHLPGCEPGHTKAGAEMDLLGPALRSNARAAASAAYFYEKPAALCECYHSLGWSGTLQDAKLIAEGLLLMGVTWLVPHGFFYSTHALKKHDAPPSFFFQMPYWPLFGHLSRRVDAIAQRFDKSFIDAEVIVVDPTAGLPRREDLEGYQRLLNLLMQARVDFLIGDTDVLQAGKIEKNPAGTAEFKIRDLSVKLVILPPMQVVEEELAAWLDDFQAAGGAVLRLDAAFDAEEAKSRILEVARPHLALTVVSGDEKWLYTVTRKKGGRRLWLLLNTGREPLEVMIQSARPLAEVVLEEDALPMLRREGAGYRRTLAGFESVMLEELDESETSPQGLRDTPEAMAAQQGPAAARAQSLPPPHVVPIRVRGPMRIVPQNLNLLRLNRWEMTLIGPGGETLEKAPTRAMPIANQLAETGLRIAPKVQEFFGLSPRLWLPRLGVRYTATFASKYEGEVQLVVEPGSLAGDWQIVINGEHRIEPGHLAPTPAHVRGSLGVDITPWIREGTNEIVVELSTDRPDGGLVNPLYLAGNFGVRLDPPTLIPPVEWGSFDDWEENGLPYYAGVVEYTGECFIEPEELANLKSGALLVGEIDFGIPFDDACEVALNGGPWRPVLWSPRRIALDREELRPGSNLIQIRVYTTLIRAFEGQRFDIPSHSYREIG